MTIPGTMTCIVCPRGCELALARGQGTEAGDDTIAVEGAGCRRGVEYALREIRDPRRLLTSTVRTTSVTRPRLPVRSSAPIPLPRMAEAVGALGSIVATPPLAAGEVIARDWLGLGVDLVAGDDLE
jgi:CxxC motif-containing protein